MSRVPEFVVRKKMARNPSGVSHQRDILLMDEPTSSVDSRTEHQLQATLAVLANERTVVVVAHRLSTVADFDQIIVLERGSIVAVGRHEELMVQEGVYREMALRQGLGSRSAIH